MIISIALSILTVLSLLFGGSNVTEPPTFNDSHIEQLAETLQDENKAANIDYVAEVLKDDEPTDAFINDIAPIQKGVFVIGEQGSSEFESKQADQYDYTDDFKHDKGVYVLSFKNDDCVKIEKIGELK